MLWALGMIPWLALVYSTLQSSPRCSTEVRLWNGWRSYNSPLWCLMIELSMSTISSYLSMSAQTLGPQSASLWAQNHCSTLGIPKSSDASLSGINMILLYTPLTCVSPKWYTCFDTELIKGSSWIVWRRDRWAMCVLCRIFVVDSRLKTVAESTSYQPWSVRYDSICSI